MVINTNLQAQGTSTLLMHSSNMLAQSLQRLRFAEAQLPHTDPGGPAGTSVPLQEPLPLLWQTKAAVHEEMA